MKQVQAKIFLSEERGYFESDWFRTFNTFNFGAYTNQYKAPFETLYGFNEDTLAAGKQTSVEVPQNAVVVVIPLAGKIACITSTGEVLLRAGEACLVSVYKGTTVTFQNLLVKETVSYLHIWVAAKHEQHNNAQQLAGFDLRQQPGILCKIFDHKSVVLSIGLFNGRSEGVYTSGSSGNVFAFVLSGVFELQNRLLHAGDGLAFWKVQAVEFEALCNHAIIVLAEIS